MAENDAAARQVKDKYGDAWRAQGWHTISPQKDAGGDYYLRIGVDLDRPLPAPHAVEGVSLVFEHAPHARAQAR